MRYLSGVRLLLFVSLALLYSQLSVTMSAAEDRSITGWEMGGEYDRLYRPDQYTKIKGTLVEIIDVVPKPGMVLGLGMIVELRNNERVTVHFAPKWFARFLKYGFKSGDRVKVKGCWAEIDNKKVFLGSKVRNGEIFEMKFRRTKDGTPYWTLTPDEMIKEKLED